MKLLVLGGTVFVGRHIVESALAAGHEVTIFHRGRHGKGLFPGAEEVFGDRDTDLHLLDGRRWDAVIDTSAYVPRQVEAAARRLGEAVDRYVFISTIAVYDREASDGLVHVTGHPRREELRRLYGWVRPQVLVPVHGEPVHLQAHARLGREAGIPKLVMMFMTLQPQAASTCWAGRVRARRVRPISCL